MDQLGGRRGCRARQIAFFGQQHAPAAAGGIARDTGAVDAAADDQQVEDIRAHSPVLALLAAGWEGWLASCACAARSAGGIRVGIRLL